MKGIAKNGGQTEAHSRRYRKRAGMLKIHFKLLRQSAYYKQVSFSGATVESSATKNGSGEF